VLGKSALKNGITLWRLLSDRPYFKLIEDQALEIKKVRAGSEPNHVSFMQELIAIFDQFRLNKKQACLPRSYQRHQAIAR
jgi:hypothetical protein